MTVKEVLEQIEYNEVDGTITSLSTGKTYSVDDFCNQIAEKLKWSNKKKQELRKHFTTYLKPETEEAIYTEEFIKKYDIKFTDGVYMINGKVMPLDDLYRFMWERERLLPDDLKGTLANIELISEPIDLKQGMFDNMIAKCRRGVVQKSEYLASLDRLYPEIPFRKLIYNILAIKKKPLVHIFYDDGVGGTGKSTLLEVLTKIVGENNVSNVLLDQFGNRFVFANMLGKYLNIGDDNGRNDELQNVGTLKSIVTGGRVTVDRKFLPPLDVRITATQLFATNIMPYIDFTDGGLMRRLNIVPMNRVIPKDAKMPVIDDKEISAILYEVFFAKGAGDLETNNNELAITLSPLYRFLSGTGTKTYSAYQSFCQDYGFRCMNIINFEVKKKFVDAYIGRDKSIDKLKEINVPEEDMPF